MRNARNLCEDTAPLIKNIITRVIKDTGAVYRDDDDGFKVYDLDILNVQKNLDTDADKAAEESSEEDDPKTKEPELTTTFKKLMELQLVN